MAGRGTGADAGTRARPDPPAPGDPCTMCGHPLRLVRRPTATVLRCVFCGLVMRV